MSDKRKPNSRLGMFLKKIADKDFDLTTLTPPVPINEVEQALADIAENSGSGLPEVVGSGKALVSINDEWVTQDGYGYSGVEAVTLINETVTLYEAGGVATGTFSKAFELVVGDSYNVTIDGVEHKGLVAQDVGGSSTLVRIMDGEVGSATFAVLMTKAALSPECTFTLVDSSDIGNHAVKVEHITEVTRKIDSKYLPKELPAYPAGDGSYVLTCTIASGVATLEWEAAESAG